MTYDTINDARTIAGNADGTLLANRYRIVKQLGQGGPRARPSRNPIDAGDKFCYNVRVF